MSEIYVVKPDGETDTLTIDSGLTLMEHLREADYDEVQALCGGSCSCATCHVYIEKVVGELAPVEDGEEMLLEMADDYDPNKSRLSCQIELDDSHHGLTVALIKAGF